MHLITTAQRIKFYVVPEDAGGNPARIDGIPKWQISDTALATIEPAADGLSCYVIPVGVLGMVQIMASADADLGAGVNTISATDDISIEAGAAVRLGMRADAPEPR